MKKANLSSQDVRYKILQLRDSIVLNLEFIQEAVDRDLIFLKKYYERYGDLNYRPVIGRDVDQNANYGERTELMIEPLAGKYRATIKSLLDSIRLIESEILPEDNPEGAQTTPSANPEQAGAKRASLRAEFTTAAGTSGKAIEPDNTDYEDDDNEESNPIPPTKLVEKPKPLPKAPSKPTAVPKPVDDTKTVHKPWRTKPQQTLIRVESPIEEQSTESIPEPIVEKKPLKLLQNPKPLDAESERLRAELMSLKGGSKMQGLMSKYSRKRDEDED